MSNEARLSVFNSLKNRWFDRLGLVGYEEERFNAHAHYLFMRAILENETPQEVEEALKSPQESATSKSAARDVTAQRNDKLGALRSLVGLVRRRMK